MPKDQNMEAKSYALISVLLLGVLCSCASAYYFPDGPPHRPLRQAVPTGNVTTFKPEPRHPDRRQDLSEQIPTFKPEPRQPDRRQVLPKQIPTFKPEPRQPEQKQVFPKVTAIPGTKQEVPKPIPTAPNNSSTSPPLYVVSMDYVPVNPDTKGLDEPPKPEPRTFPGIQMVPKQEGLPHSERQRQSISCSQTFSFSQPGQSANLESPNYPREYPNNVQSSVCFTSPSDTTMTIVCEDFNVENSRSCSYDYFGIALSGNPNSIQKYCGRGTLRSPSTSGNSLAIVFKSDRSNPGSTSRNPHRFRCTITVSGSSSGGGNNPSTTVAPPPPGNCTCGRRNDGSRIVGGTNAQVNEFPWRCYLKTNRYSFFCGCSIISNRWILTAAHCTAAVMPLQSGDVLYVVVGDHDRSSSTSSARQQIAVETISDDPAYNDKTMDHDISLLKLSRSLTFTNAISPICLPFNYVNDEFSGTTVTASGWGTTSQGGSVSNILQKVDLPVLTTAQCTEYYPGQITERMICTFSPGKKDTCQGDSGGSIDLNRNGRYYHIGVVSWGIGCAGETHPGVYSFTTKFLNWITSTSGESFCRV